jgi:predicted outer membrane repeat protein
MSKSAVSSRTITIVLFILCCCVRLDADTWYIKADGSGDAATIQSAVYQAADWDTILVAAGRYTGVGNKDIDFLEKILVVRSESGPRVTFIDCEGEGRGFQFYNGETSSSRLEGFTIINGNATAGDGGAIECRGNSSPTIINCIIRNNRAASYGGGISCRAGSSPLISDCAVIKNRAFSGGGIYADQNSSPIVNRCIIAEDSSYSGGGVLFVGGSPTLNTCLVIQNQALFGGGIACSGSAVEIVRCSIVGNRATFGGGMALSNSSPIIGDSPDQSNSIYNNFATQAGANLRTSVPIKVAESNFWGRVNDSQADSLAILEGMDLRSGAYVVFWPIATEPRTITHKVKAVTDTLYFPEVKISFDQLTMNLFGDSTISVTAWPDSMPPNVFGGEPVEKWFHILPGSGILGFSANLTLGYTQLELDSSDIVDEDSIYCARHFDGQWTSCPGTADPQANWVQCATPQLSIWAIGGPGGSLTPVPQGEDIPARPEDFRLSQNYPNPFNAATTISFWLPVGSPVSLKIYNVSGQMVRSLLEDHLLSGWHALTWDGTDSRGRRVGSGLYFCRLQAASDQQTGKMVLLR